ncbi:hypothetical protein [Alcanivorax sp.]|uniref:hypothetical protein n=1 Tax=Alcanivorax sp. TaxID=1872427 RepID=UPI0025BBBCCC|nr:hypothetical protein [Alcanivorax sp.]
MTKEDEKENKKNDLPKWLVPTGLLIPTSAAVTYALYFRNYTVGGPGDWGTFGDFLGGISNPLLGFLTIFLLVASLRLQAKELKESTNAVKQSAHELTLTRKIYKNQETLQIRENLRPQVKLELERRIKKCQKILNSNLTPSITLRDVIAAKGDISAIRTSLFSTTTTEDIANTSRIFDKKRKTYKVAVSSVVDCLCSQIELSDSDIVIHPEVARACEHIQRLVHGQIATYSEANELYYSKIDAALVERQCKEKFPPLHISGLHIQEFIESQRKAAKPD